VEKSGGLHNDILAHAANLSLVSLSCFFFFQEPV